MRRCVRCRRPVKCQSALAGKPPIGLGKANQCAIDGPNGLSQTREVLTFLAEKLGKGVAVSLMAQFHPSHRAGGHPLLMRPVSAAEYGRALEALEEAGLEEGYIQELSSPTNYLPDFDAEGHPFER